MITITITRFDRHGLPVTRSETHTSPELASALADRYADAGWLVSTQTF
jgi:hypothetical protein